MSNKKGSAPPRYDEEFKKGAMALVTEKGMPLKTAAKDLGMNLSIILDTFNSNKIKQLPISHENTVSA